MNGKVEVTCITLRTVAHSLMVNDRVLEVYVHFALMYMIDQIFPVLPIKDIINNYGNPTTPHNPATGTKPSVSYLHVFVSMCAVDLRTTHGQNNTCK